MNKAVLLLAFGGPTKHEEIEPFIRSVSEGHSIPEARIKLVVEQYQAIGGVSPLNKITFEQAKALEEEYKKMNSPSKVYVGFQHSSPRILDALSQMKSENVVEAIGIVLSPFRSPASWDRYLEKVEAAKKSLGGILQIKFCEPWHENPLFIDAIASQIEEAVLNHPQVQKSFWLFTAHSVPLEMDVGWGAGPRPDPQPYSAQVRKTAELVAKRFGNKNWEVVYQSRSGRWQDLWLEPDIGEKIRELATKGIRSVTAIPIGFVADHVEVLYDLDIKAKNVAEELKVEFFRVKTVNDHPKFIEMLSRLVMVP